MLRCIELSGVESITRLILNEIIKAGELRFEEQMGFYPVWYTVENKNEVIKHFSKAMNTVLLQNAYFSKVYLTLNLIDKTRMKNEIAKHFVNAYPDSFLHFDCLNVSHDNSYHAYLLEEIFWSYLSNIKSREKRYDKIHDILVNQINIPLTTFMDDVNYQKQLATLAMGYADKLSMFAKLPKELVTEIKHVMSSVHAKNTLAQPTC